MKEKLLLAAASLLGFATACENKRTVDMYGTPYFDYKVKGKVTDKEGAPVKGIEVGSQDAGPVTSGSAAPTSFRAGSGPSAKRR